MRELRSIRISCDVTLLLLLLLLLLTECGSLAER